MRNANDRSPASAPLKASTKSREKREEFGVMTQGRRSGMSPMCKVEKAGAKIVVLKLDSPDIGVFKKDRVHRGGPYS
jgi:hypothetical protein